MATTLLDQERYICLQVQVKLLLLFSYYYFTGWIHNHKILLGVSLLLGLYLLRWVSEPYGLMVLQNINVIRENNRAQ